LTALPRVVMVLSNFYPIVGGGERQAQQLAARLVGRGLDVCVLTRRYPSLSSFERVDGVPVYRVPVWGRTDPILMGPDTRSPVQATTFILGALKLLAHPALRGAILHCHQSSMGVAPSAIAALAKRLIPAKGAARIGDTGSKVIVKFMGSRVREMAHTHTWPARRWLLCQADAFVVTNESTAKALSGMGLDVPTYCLPNGVDLARFRPVAPETRADLRGRLGLPSEALVVLYVGRLEPVKGADLLLHAWASFVGREVGRTSGSGPTGSHRGGRGGGQGGIRTPVLALVGDGSERERLVRLSRSLSIERSVRFVGAVGADSVQTQADNVPPVADWLNAADLFVLPSRSEGVSNALLEAMACALPALATAVGGSPEVIEDGVNGVLLPPEDPGALTDGLLHLARDPGLARTLGAAARQTIEARFSMEAVVQRYEELYLRLTDVRCPRGSEWGR
jgi:glycosyltransferase involved in cell wall biosynthesis